MKKIINFLLLLATFSALASEINPNMVQVINTGNDFHLFWKKAEGKNFEEQEKLWSEFEDKYREIYDNVVFDKTNPNWQNKRIERLKTFFSKLPSLVSKMEILFDTAEEISTSQANKFKKTFPDLQEGTPIVFLPGITFNGKAQPLGSFGRSALFIGVDMVAERNDSIDVLFSHEFFHIYQFEFLKNKSIWQTFSSPLWFEGFATYVSGLLNPTVSEDILLMDADLTEECSKAPNVQKWAELYLSFYNNGNLDENTLNQYYKDWFQISGSSNPKRRGYCLGLRVIQEVAKENTVPSMVQWDEPTFGLKIGEALTKLAK